MDGAPTLATILPHPAPAPSRDEIATATAAASALVVTSGDSSHPNKRSRKPVVAASSASNDAAAATKVILVALDPPPPALPLPPSTATAAEPSLQRSSARIRQTRKSVPSLTAVVAHDVPSLVQPETEPTETVPQMNHCTQEDVAADGNPAPHPCLIDAVAPCAAVGPVTRSSKRVKGLLFFSFLHLVQ